ncbi:MAG: hypothetical protein ACLGJB_21580 [Blastocatellia bacterium]
MSEAKKYVTFRDLKDLGKNNELAQEDKSSTSTPSISSNTSISSTTGIARATRSSSTSQINRSIPKTSTDKSRESLRRSVAPERDFQRVPNSVTREALQGGIFRGKSKQVWDYLWSISRGAVVPNRIVRKSRKEIKAGAGLGSMVTVDAAIEHLKSIGLLAVRPAVGSLIGNEYEIFTPEELALSPGRSTGISSTSSTTSLTHKVDVLDIPDSGISSTSQPLANTTTYVPTNTFFKTDDDDDTHTLLTYFSETLICAAREIVGGPLSVSEQERVLWNECACVLADELKKAAKQTQGISSVPAFLTAHLRRRFAPKQKTDAKVINREVTTKTNAVGTERSVQQVDPNVKPAWENTPPGSKYSLEECRQYAEHLHKTGQGINKPGGYATTIYRTGEADTLIGKFLNPADPQPLDTTMCPECKGVGFTYPEGVERGGVAKCNHPRLGTALKLLEYIEHLRLVHKGDAGYQVSDLIDDLKFRCERDSLDWDEELVARLLET